MERAQAGVILCPRLPQTDVAANDADNVGLLLEGLREVGGESHELPGAEVIGKTELQERLSATSVLLGI